MLNKAIQFAANAHAGQLRKGTRLPYILHPMEAAVIVSSMTQDLELISAALLHDTIEDCPGITIELIHEEFGSRIASLVQQESENKQQSWIERKKSTIEHLKTACNDVKIIALGDKLSNLRSLYHDSQKIGDQLWNRFHVTDKQLHRWYYQNLLVSLNSLEHYPAYQEYKMLLDQVFCENRKEC